MVITDQNQRFFPCFTPTTQSIQQSKDFFFHQTANRELDNIMKDAFCTIHKEKMKCFCREKLNLISMILRWKVVFEYLPICDLKLQTFVNCQHFYSDFSSGKSFGKIL